MKQIILVFALVITSSTLIRSQDVQDRLDEALTSYRSEDLDNARFSLQEALNEINQAVGNEILGLLPTEMSGMNRVEDADEVTGANMGFASLFIHRTYQDEGREASIDIISDSPMLAGVNTLLAMPGFMTTDDSQKRVKIGGYKALLSKSEDENGGISYDVQVPLSSSLLTFECQGIADENEVLEMANSIPVDKIAEISE